MIELLKKTQELLVGVLELKAERDVLKKENALLKEHIEMLKQIIDNKTPRL